MAEMGTQQRDRNNVKKNHKRILEPGDDHAIYVMAGRIGGILHRSQIGIEADREVENVKDDKSDHGETAPDHDAGTGRSLHGGITGIAGIPGGPILLNEGNRRDNVKDKCPENADPGEPDSPSVKHVVKKFSVVIEVLPPLKDEEVSRHVTEEESYQHQAGDGDDQLFPDRRVPESEESFAKRVHFRFLKQYDGYLQGDGFGKM